eukprot:Platyproteum_vivax@DN12892_c0_g1_i1.p1
MSIRRASARVSEALPLRMQAKHMKKPLGKYPVSQELTHYWAARFQVPVGEVVQHISPFQSKITWQYVHGYAARNWGRIEKHFWRTIIPFGWFQLMCFKQDFSNQFYLRGKFWY